MGSKSFHTETAKATFNEGADSSDQRLDEYKKKQIPATI